MQTVAVVKNWLSCDIKRFEFFGKLRVVKCFFVAKSYLRRSQSIYNGKSNSAEVNNSFLFSTGNRYLAKKFYFGRIFYFKKLIEAC